MKLISRFQNIRIGFQTQKEAELTRNLVLHISHDRAFWSRILVAKDV